MATDELAVSMFTEIAVDAAVGPQRIVLCAQAYEVAVGGSAGECGAQELVLVNHLLPAPPADAVARHEADLPGQRAAERRFVHPGIKVNVEVGAVVERSDEARQMFGVAVGRDEVSQTVGWGGLFSVFRDGLRG